MNFEQVQVECYSGYKACERPTAFMCKGCRLQISEIVDCWYEGGAKANEPVVDYFKVRTAEGKIFLLRYLSLFDTWSVRV